MTPATAIRNQGISRRRRVLIDNLTAYAFILPAAVLIFLFGIFPVLFALFVSLHKWRRFPDEFIGLSNFERALGDFAYVLFFGLALAALVGGLWLLGKLLQTAYSTRRWQDVFYLLAGGLNAAFIVLAGRWFVLLLPDVLNIPRRIRGLETTRGLFITELGNSLQNPVNAEHGSQALLLLIIAVIVSVAALRWLRGGGGTALWRASAGLGLLAAGTLIMQLTLQTISTAIETARIAGTELPIWSQIILISSGAVLVYAAYRLWKYAVVADGNTRFIVTTMAAMLLVLGGYLFIAELPRLLASADKAMLTSFNVTVMYAAFSIPFQLIFGLGLAYLLFENIKGRSFFRMVLFMPYIMPFVATALVFTIIFSHRENSIVNNIVGWVGITPQKWLLEPIGVGRLMFGSETPAVLSGPSLALVVVIIYTIWTYTGYATVVFLAGLGNIPNELYEAARIDGASGWAIFRRITLPLLSPTTSFLSLVAVIGTFQAFTQLWLMRSPASRDTLDTVSIVIFRQITDASPNYGYGAAMAFVLFGVILMLTITQSRLSRGSVFYG